ncbi:MAG TPA: reverse transcriptase-like protein [Terrimesophilobacter sp.]|nr:reverse transcriptase-like protein [Terrimesophilobacter sp.]
MARVLIVEADGGSRGNPGLAGSGSVVIDAATGEVLAEVGRYLGQASNNVAEYTALIEGVRRALQLDADAELYVRMDSKLVIEQMSGRWKIKHPDMAELAAVARGLLTGTPVRFEWIPRLQNARADAVANRAMDLRADFG